MLIEDDINMFSLLQMLLEFEGYEVARWEGDEQVQEIMSLMQREQPALVLLDVNLRHLSGFDVLRGLRQDPGLKDTRVLMASGMDLTSQCLQAGADGFILKPFMPDELIDKIQKTLL
jgi:DNA-binding response OmpR family regulator